MTLVEGRDRIVADGPAGATPGEGGATPPQTNPAQSGAPQQQPPNGAPQPPATGADGDQADLGDKGKRAIDRERERAETAERELKATKLRLRTFEDRDKTDAERSQDRIADLEARLEDELVARTEAQLERATHTAARKLGFRNPDIAYRLIAPAEVDFAEDGTPKNVEQLLKDLVKSDPYLVGAGGPPDSGLGPRGAPAGPSVDMNTIIRQATGRR